MFFSFIATSPMLNILSIDALLLNHGYNYTIIV